MVVRARGRCTCTTHACVYAVGVVGFKAARSSARRRGWGMCKMWPETGSELKFTLDSLTPAIGGTRLNAAPGQLDVIGRVVYRR